MVVLIRMPNLRMTAIDAALLRQRPRGDRTHRTLAATARNPVNDGPPGPARGPGYPCDATARLVMRHGHPWYESFRPGYLVHWRERHGSEREAAG